MHPFVTYTRWTRAWPGWMRYGAATLTVAAVLLLGVWLNPLLSGFPFLLFFLAILVNAGLFGRAAGAYSVLLSAAIAVFFVFVTPRSAPFNAPARATEIILFMIAALAASAAMASLRSSMHDLAQANERLAAAEREKDLLLRETGHRVKNDLASLMALVRLQERSVSDPAARAALASTGERIRVLSRLHERLRRADKAAVVDIGRFITELCDDLRAALHGLRPVALKVHAESCLLPQEQAVAVGLITNELLTNALKYAFPDDRSGTVAVRFARDGDSFELVVADDGIGVSPEAPSRGSSGLGQRLVRSLAAQLGGIVEIGPNSEAGGTKAVARFPAKA
jgi:two-component system, sensor histidine kinase PdtaS